MSEFANKFQSYQSYKDLCRNNAFFMESLKPQINNFETINLRDFLKYNQKISSLGDCLNLIYEILNVYQIIEKKKLYLENCYDLNLANWFLNGKILQTNNFHPDMIIINYKKEEIDKYFKYSLETKKEEKRKNLLYDIGLLFYRFLNGNFIKDQETINKTYFSENSQLNQELKEIIIKMMNLTLDISECIDYIKNFYRKFIFKLTLDSSTCILYPLIKDYTISVHKFLNFLSFQKINYDLVIKFNIILGHLVVFLRNILSLPINYENFNQKICFFCEEIEKENTKYHEFYENYFEMVTLYIKDEQAGEKKIFLKELSDLLKDNDMSQVYSLKNIEANASSTYSLFGGIEKNIIDIFIEFMHPWRNYEKCYIELYTKLEKINRNYSKCFKYMVHK